MKTRLLERQRVRQLRSQGWSLCQIAAEVGVTAASISVWVRDIQLTEEQKAALKSRERIAGERGRQTGPTRYSKRCQENRKQWFEAGREKARAKEPLHLAGCMLYWVKAARQIATALASLTRIPR